MKVHIVTKYKLEEDSEENFTDDKNSNIINNTNSSFKNKEKFEEIIGYINTKRNN